MEQITDVKNLHECAHEQCHCQVRSTEEYCSDHCSDADDVAEIVLTCSCGHTPCARNGMDA